MNHACGQDSLLCIPRTRTIVKEPSSSSRRSEIPNGFVRSHALYEADSIRSRSQFRSSQASPGATGRQFSSLRHKRFPEDVTNPVFRQSVMVTKVMLNP